jgi:predicted alpha/beta hydrolase
MTCHDFYRTQRPVLLLLPAMGVAARYYEPLAAELGRTCNATVLSLDLPGQGDSPLHASRGDDYGYREVVETCIPKAIQRAAVDYPGRPLILLGHSLGGQLALLATAQMADSLQGLVLIAAGTAHWRAWPKGTRWRAALTVHAVRAVASILPWYPGGRLGFGGNQSRRFMCDWSFNACSGRYRLDGSERTPERIENALRDVRLPVLSVALRGDPVAPAGAETELLAKLPCARIDRAVIEGVKADAPWRRHFSWARAPAEAAMAVASWLERQRHARCW